MEELFKQRIIEAWRSLPEDVRGRSASDKEMREFEEWMGRYIPPDFRWFLETCGGCPVGSEWVEGIETLQRNHKKLAEESVEPNSWTMKDIFIIGWDGGGNPYGICTRTGRVLVEDHDFGGIHELAPSFEEFLRKGLLDCK